MAQTLNSLSWANCLIELSDDDGATWEDISGFANSISVDGGERAVGEFFTADGDTPIITSGKRGSLEIAIKAVYTEDAVDAPYIMAQEAYDNHTNLRIRWSPKGGGVGTFRFTAAEGPVLKPVLPQGAADSSDAIPIELTIKTLSIVKATVTV
jgi:hypothetical protein